MFAHIFDLSTHPTACGLKPATGSKTTLKLNHTRDLLLNRDRPLTSFWVRKERGTSYYLPLSQPNWGNYSPIRLSHQRMNTCSLSEQNQPTWWQQTRPWGDRDAGNYQRSDDSKYFMHVKWMVKCTFWKIKILNISLWWSWCFSVSICISFQMVIMSRSFCPVVTLKPEFDNVPIFFR